MSKRSFIRTGKKVLASIASAALALALVPAAAFGATTESCSSGESCTEHVAAIGDTHYDDLASAFEAAQPGDTVKLLKEEYTDPAPATGYTVYDMSGVTFDLNGNTYISANFTHVFQGNNGTIKNGKMVCSNEGSYALFIGDEETTEGFIVEGVECQGGINIYNANDVVLKDNTAAGTNYYSVWLDENASAVIEGGSYTTGKVALFALEKDGDSFYSKLTVKGGTFSTYYTDNETNGGNKPLLLEGYGTRLSIMGGTFSSDPTIYVAEHCKIADKDNGTWIVTEDPKVAEVNGEQFYTLADAISNSNEATITLLEDVTEDVVISEGKTITLDLNGKTLTNASGHTITNNGALTINGTGTVDNVAHARAAILNNGAIILNGGSYTRSLENGISKEENGGNSYYNILNHGTIAINKGVSVSQDGHYSSMICNGGDAAGSLTIAGGNFAGGLNTVKNDANGSLTIEGGSFSNTSQYVIMNWNEATISGGEFKTAETASAVLFSGSFGKGAAGKMSVTGGTFTAATPEQPVAVHFVESLAEKYPNDYSEGTIAITGGSFSADPKEYVPTSGYQIHKNGSYYHVHATAGTTVSGATSATCTSAGFTGNTVCADCGMLITAGSTIPALGHAYGAYVTTVAPTETSTGTAVSTCSRCGATQSMTLAKLEPAGSDITATASDGSKVDVVINTNPSGTGSSAVNGTVTYNGPAEGSMATSVSIPATVTIGGSTYDVATIAEGAFANNSTITSVTIPSTVTTIGEGAFENCTSLISVTVPAGVTTVAESTFAGCTSLATVEIKGSVTEIASSAFEGCSALSSIEIPSTVTEIGESAFAGCSALTTITVPAGVTEIAASAFANCESLGTVELGSATTTIGESAFEGCGKLTNIEIPSTVTTIGEKAFANSGLATVTLPAGVTTIAASAFADCADLAYATMQGSIAEIGEKAFENCTSLKTIAIPASVKTIGASAFEGCSSLNSAAISGKTEVGARAFANSGVTAVSIGKNVELGTGVFRDCTKLTTATVKAATLPSYAFKGCTALKSVSLAKGVTTIERSAFSGCKSLKNIVLPSSVEKIAKYAFYGASKAKTITVNSKKLTKSDVKNALKGSSVTTVKCPKSMVSAYKKIFTRANCGKSVTVKGI